MTLAEPEPCDTAADLEGETWKPAPDFEGYYEVSDMGRVRVLDRWVNAGRDGRRFNPGRIMKRGLVGSGYLAVGFVVSGQKKANRLVHSLVLETFVGPRPKGMVACHIDGDRYNNRLENLRWDTQKSNLEDAHALGRRSFSKGVRRLAPVHDSEDLAGEEWVAVPGYEGSYEVSTCGRVRSLDRYSEGRGNRRLIRGQLLRLGNSGGHLNVAFRKDGRAKSRYVHHVVLEAFVGPRPEGYLACHNDGNPLNNSVENLRWDTPANNLLDMVNHGVHWQAFKTHCPAGHPYTPENLIAKRYGRDCRICANARRRKGTPSAVEINRNKTHCAKGHEFTPENTRIRKPTATHHGGRECRACDRERLPQELAAKARRRAAAQAAQH